MRLSARKLAERLSLYLPVLLMGVLALGTYWLVRITPQISPAAPPGPVRHDPDYRMQQFSVRSFDGEGKLKSEVLGTDARHFPDTDMLEIDSVRIRSFDASGLLTTATARRALVNGDSSELQLFGDARVLREPGPDRAGQRQPRLEFRGEYLQAFLKTERVLSSQPVQLQRGDDQFTADSLEADNQSQVIQLTGRVRGTLRPTAAEAPAK
jgi:lipopolysaccharide export system protein LptC